MFICGPSMVRGSASSARECIFEMVHKRLQRYHIGVATFCARHHSRKSQTFCQEAVMWKYLTHPNVLPFLGVTISPLQLISDWMPGGDLPGYIEKHSDADRIELVSGLSVVSVQCLFLLPVVRHHQRPGLPPLLQHDTWRSQGGMRFS